ncbi:MAG: type II toxin-antitoxin system VapC family toxin [Thermoguttaceae bacterium]|jgi:predicted nucleic acid-binding protein
MENEKSGSATIYLETTIVSYLTSRPHRDIVIAAQQEITRQWWENEKQRYHCVISPYVFEEALAGDTQAADKRIQVLKDIEILPLFPEIELLAEKIGSALRIPATARMDAFHLACVVFHEIDYLLTWNCAHLANGPRLKQLARFLQSESLWQPLVCTPNEMIEL